MCLPPVETVPGNELSAIIARKNEAETLVTEELLWKVVDFYVHDEPVLFASLDTLSMRKDFRSGWDCWIVLTVKTIDELYRVGFYLTDFMERDKLRADETMKRAFTEKYTMKWQHNPYAQ